MKIKFKNWQSLVKRQGGIVRASWFAMDHNLFSEPFFCELDCDERMTYIYLICEASKSAERGTVLVSEKHFHMFCHKPSQVLYHTIEKLIRFQIVDKARDRGAYVKVPENRIEENRIELISSAFPMQDTFPLEEKNQHNGLAPARESREVSYSDLEEVYKTLYPLKKGKRRGMVLALKKVRTLEQLEALKRGIVNYSKVAKPGFVQHFDTFMSKETYLDEAYQDTASESTALTMDQYKKIVAGGK